MGDWIGTGTIASFNIKFRDFNNARAFARKLNFQTKTQWMKYCKSGEKPNDIPTVPENTYRNKGWISIYDWLGTRKGWKLGDYESFEGARNFVRKLKLKSKSEWEEYRKSGKKPYNIPNKPRGHYVKSGWLSWGDFLGTLPGWDGNFLSFKEAKKVVRSLKIKSRDEWRIKSKDLYNIPVALSNVYKEYLDSELKLLDPTKIPLQYKQLVTENIIYKKNSLGKIKYNDKNYHTSRIIKFYTEKSTFKKKPEKEFEIIYKKIKRNKKYKTSLKDIILFETLESDGIIIPKELIDQETVKNNLPPPELLNLGKNKETGLLLLRIVELIGEDEILDLDPQTIYFINHLLIKSGLKK